MSLFVREIGEFGLLRRLRAIVERHDECVLVGMGDDGAVVRYSRPVVMSTDALVEGIHFRTDWIDYTAVGYKALVASLSDIAAMGGRPLHALITLALPKDAQVEPLEELYRGVRAACDEYAVSVVGGDIVGTDGPLLISVTVTGELLGAKPLLRSGAEVGDLVFVTGDLGGSAAYLHLRQHQSDAYLAPEDEWILRARHCQPVPQIRAGEALALQSQCTATNDVSDGLASELHEIAEASGVHMAVEVERLPTLPAVRHYARIARVNPHDFALFGGEDYQIVGTVRRSAAGALLAVMEGLGIRLSMIGRVEEGEPGVDLLSGAERSELPKQGYDHFLPRGGM